MRLFLFLNGTIKTVHTAPWPHYRTKYVFSDRWNLLYCMEQSSIAPQRGAMEGCSIVQIQQLQMLYCQRCCMTASQCMFGSLWNAVVAHEHRRQHGSRRLDTMVKCQTATDEQVSQPWSRRADVLVASEADWTSSTSNQTGGSILNWLQPMCVCYM